MTLDCDSLATEESPPLTAATSAHEIDHLPLQIAMDLRDKRRADGARVAQAAPEVRAILPIALALARLAAAADIRAARKCADQLDINS